MIEFNGYLSGKAENHFHNKGRKLARNILFISTLLLLPAIAIAAIRMQFWGLLITYCVIILLIPLMTMIPQSKKGKQGLTPKRIFTEEEYIVCIADQYIEHRLIEDVKTVYDYDEFYELVFPFGKISEKFVCQKQLLSKGTLEEFEALFEGKIIKKH